MHLTGQPLVQFTFEEEAVEAFTCGDCAWLAVEIRRLTGWALVTVSENSEPRGWSHAGVLMPDGNILDIEGVWVEEDWLARWNDNFDDDQFVRLWEPDADPNADFGPQVVEAGQMYYDHPVEHWAPQVLALVPVMV